MLPEQVDFDSIVPNNIDSLPRHYPYHTWGWFPSITPCTDATWKPADSGNWLGMTNDKDDVVPIGDPDPLL